MIHIHKNQSNFDSHTNLENMMMDGVVSRFKWSLEYMIDDEVLLHALCLQEISCKEEAFSYSIERNITGNG